MIILLYFEFKLNQDAMNTMKDPDYIERYTQKVYKLFERTNHQISPNLFEGLENIISGIHERLEIPRPSFMEGRSTNVNGEFVARTWQITINQHALTNNDRLRSQYSMNKDIESVFERFLEIACCYYHEARHTEQHWLIICLLIEIFDNDTILSSYPSEDIDIIQNFIRAYPDHELV